VNTRRVTPRPRANQSRNPNSAPSAGTQLELEVAEQVARYRRTSQTGPQHVSHGLLLLLSKLSARRARGER